MIRSTLGTLTKQTMGRVRRRTSTKQRSMILVVRSFLHRCRGKLKTTATPADRAPVVAPSSHTPTASGGGRSEKRLRPDAGCRRDRSPGHRLSPRHGRDGVLYPGYCASCAPSSADAVPGAKTLWLRCCVGAADTAT